MNYNYKRNKAIIDLEKKIELLDLFNPYDFNKYDLKILIKNNCGDENRNIIYLIKELNSYKKYLKNISNYKLIIGSFQCVLTTMMNILQDAKCVTESVNFSDFSYNIRTEADVKYQMLINQINNLSLISDYDGFFLLNGSNKINKLYISSKKNCNQHIYFKTFDCTLEGLLLKNTNLFSLINSICACNQVIYAMDRINYFRNELKAIENELNKYEKLYKSKSEFYLQKFIDWKCDKREEYTDQINNIQITLD